VVCLFILEFWFIRLTEVITNVDISFVLDRGDGQAGQSTGTQPVTMNLRITVTSNSTSASVPPNILAGGDNPAEEAPTPTVTPDSRLPGRSTEIEHPIPPPGCLPGVGGAPLPQGQGDMPLVKEARIGLDRADEVEKSVDSSDTWEGVVRRVKWLMDTLSPVAGVRVMFVSPVLN
jgi:hypothetical protein